MSCLDDDIKYCIASGAIKELINQIEFSLIKPSADSAERIIEMSESIIDIMTKYKETLV